MFFCITPYLINNPNKKKCHTDNMRGKGLEYEHYSLQLSKRNQVENRTHHDANI